MVTRGSHDAISDNRHISIINAPISLVSTHIYPGGIMAVFALYASGAMALYIFLRCLLAVTQDANEPVALVNEIPFLGPLIRMRRKAKFYIDLR